MNQHSDIDIVQNIKDHLSIVDHIQKFISLKNSGRDYLGICPFHDDHKPSLRVSDDKGLFHCFSCGSGGDIIGFHMKYNNLDFVSALKELAEIAGLQMPRRSKNSKSEPNNEIFYRINIFAHKLFLKNLNETDEGKKATAYLAGRGIDKGTIKKFGIGYSVNSWNDLFDKLVQKNVPLEQAKTLGLIIQSTKAQKGYYDRFRGRIIFPIFDLNSKIAGFGGRTLFDDDPKYLNSPQSPVYDKSSILYGLSEARNDIRKENSVIIVEGYIDLLSLFQNGIKNVVATLGTSLTSNHAILLKRFCENMVIIYDGDKSGINASLRALDVFLKHGITPSVAVVPPDEDPSSLVEKVGEERFLNLIKSAKPLMDLYFDNILDEHGSGRKSTNSVIKEIAEKLSLFSDTINRSFYAKRAAEMFGLREQEIFALLSDKNVSIRSRSEIKTSQSVNSYERMFLKVLLHFPQFVEKIEEDDDIVDMLEDRRIQEIIRICTKSGLKDAAGVINHLGDPQSQAIVSELLLSSEDIDTEIIAQQVFEQSYNRIKLNSIKKEQRKIKSRLKRNTSQEPESEIELLKEYDNLVKMEKYLNEQVYGA